MIVLRASLLLAFAALFCGACGVEDEGATVGAGAARGPLVGVTGSGDAADTACQIVLRGAHRGGGFAADGSWRFEGSLDVAQAALDEGATVHVLAQSTADGVWREVNASAVSSADGVVRHTFLVDGHMPHPGWSGTALSRAVVRLAPFLRTASGESRLFDHNRIADPLGSYELRSASAFEIGDDAAVCPSRPVHLAFGASDVRQLLPVVAGEALTVSYALERLTSCRGTHNGHPAWDLRAFARFLPSGSVVDQTVRQFDAPLGVPNTTVHAVPATFSVPEGTQAVELWFHNTGIGCEAWDSQGGQNHRFGVESAGPDWMGQVVAAIDRASGAPCDGAQAFGSTVTFGTWGRQRAVRHNVCFEVYEPGVTDFDNHQLWRQLDVQLHWRANPADAFAVTYVDVLDRVGNNARYAFDIEAIDPFPAYACNLTTNTTLVEQPGNTFIQATVEWFITVNGFELRPFPGGVYTLVAQDDAGSPFRQPDCAL